MTNNNSSASPQEPSPSSHISSNEYNNNVNSNSIITNVGNTIDNKEEKEGVTAVASALRHRSDKTKDVDECEDDNSDDDGDYGQFQDTESGLPMTSEDEYINLNQRDESVKSKDNNATNPINTINEDSIVNKNSTTSTISANTITKEHSIKDSTADTSKPHDDSNEDSHAENETHVETETRDQILEPITPTEPKEPKKSSGPIDDSTKPSENTDPYSSSYLFSPPSPTTDTKRSKGPFEPNETPELSESLESVETLPDYKSALWYTEVRDYGYPNTHPLYCGVATVAPAVENGYYACGYPMDSYSSSNSNNSRFNSNDTNTYSNSNNNDDDSSNDYRNSSQYTYDEETQSYYPTQDLELHGHAVALFDFVPENDNEAPLKAGQVVWVSYRHGQGWLVAEDLATGGTGLIPEEYVQMMKEEEVQQLEQAEQAEQGGR